MSAGDLRRSVVSRHQQALLPGLATCDPGLERPYVRYAWCIRKLCSVRSFWRVCSSGWLSNDSQVQIHIQTGLDFKKKDHVCSLLQCLVSTEKAVLNRWFSEKMEQLQKLCRLGRRLFLLSDAQKIRRSVDALAWIFNVQTEVLLFPQGLENWKKEERPFRGEKNELEERFFQGI